MSIREDLKLVDMVLEQNKSMEVPVMLSYHEIDRIIINRLIQIRNSDVNSRFDMSHFDKVLKHFLDEEEFKKHVDGNVLFKAGGVR